MIVIIFGKPGIGKTSLNAAFLKQEYEQEGEYLLESCCECIESLNFGRKKPLQMPDKSPIYSDFEVSLLVDYEEYYEPYYINGFYFGLKNERLKTMNLPPYAKIHLCEAQKYFDSRKSKTFPAFVSRAFEMHRHYGLDIIMDVQRLGLIDLNVREIAGKFIEVVDCIHEEDACGGIARTTWHCREFDSYQTVRDYLEASGKDYREATYTNEGNIFEIFNSYGCFDEFVPDEGQDFAYLEHLRGKDVKQLPEEIQRYYISGEPKEYRTEPKPEKDKKR